jgi:hypothetical protein
MAIYILTISDYEGYYTCGYVDNKEELLRLWKRFDPTIEYYSECAEVIKNLNCLFDEYKLIDKTTGMRTVWINLPLEDIIRMI